MSLDRFWCAVLIAALTAPAAARAGEVAPPGEVAPSAAPVATQGGEVPPPAAPPPAATPPAAASPLRVADLGWLAGAWRGTLGGAAIEEHWSAPDGGEMLGMFRWDREPPIYELLLIEDTPEGAVMRLRHFGPGLVAWEEKEGALLFRPVEHGPCWALFAEEGDIEEATRLRYRRVDDGGLLIQLLERRDGAETSLDFRYRPVDGGAAAPACG
jgi:hypothetical protein